MKRSAKLSVFFLVLILVCSMFVLPASAATTTQDGLEVTLTADKTEYKTDEQINAKLTVKNKEAVDVSNVSLEALIPDGYKLADNTSGKKTVGTLKSGDSAELSVTYIPSKDLNVTELSNNTDSENKTNNTNSNTNTTNNTSNTTNDVKNDNTSPNPVVQSDNVLKTGDSHAYIVYIVVFIMSGVFAFVMVKKKRGKQLLSILLCITLIGAIIPLGDILVYADEVNNTINISNVVTVNGKELTHKAKVTYSALSGKSVEGAIELNMSDFMFDASTNRYCALDPVTTLEGKVENPSDVKTLSYSVKDANEKILLSGDLSVKQKSSSQKNPIYASGSAPDFNSNFSIDNFAMIIGDNTVRVEAEYKNGDKAYTEVIINNICSENMSSLTVDKGDDDNDGVLNFIEELYHTDPKNSDSDNDGLSDYDEIAILGTDPNKADSDGNGISDADEDIDGDGLSNLDEIVKYNTDPICFDTDDDGLSDGDEINIHKTSPILSDTDGDGASDSWEIEHGFDPLVAQSSFEITDTAGSELVTVSVNADLPADKAQTLSVEADYGNAFLTSAIPGYIAEPYSFSVEGGLENGATISFAFDESLKSSSEKFNPVIYYFNEEDQLLEEIETTVDMNKCVATAHVDHFSTYILLNKELFDDVWKTDIRKPNEEAVENKGMSLSFVIDISGSMSSNDPSYIRKSLTKQFIEKMSFEKDYGSIIIFDDDAKVLTELTNDKDVLVNSISSIVNDGGTNGSDGINSALNQLENDSSENDGYIIFMTDGEDNEFSYSYDDLIARAKEKNITIYTIGLGSASESILKKLATETGGKYYYASEASDLVAVFEETEHETIDYYTDSNEDGITDYYTKLLCESPAYLNGAKNPFAGFRYEDIQDKEKGADYDGDGLKNGEEISIEEKDGKVYVKMKSNPVRSNSDGDIYSDYEEVKKYNTDPMKKNALFDTSDIDYLLNDDNFVSKKYQNFYENKWYGWAERKSVWLANAYYNSKYDTTYLYKVALMEFLENTVKEEEKTKGLVGFISDSLEITNSLNDAVDGVISLGESLSSDKRDILDNLKQQIETAQKEMNGIHNGDLVNNGLTKDQVYKLWDDSYNSYSKATEEVEELNKKIEIHSFYKKGWKYANGIVTIITDVADYASTCKDFEEKYTDFKAQIDQMDNMVYILQVIKDSESSDDCLRSACAQLIKAIEEQSTTSIAVLDEMSTKSGSAVNILVKDVAPVLLDKLGYKIPVIGKIKAVLDIGGFVFNLGDVAECCANLYVISKSACYFADYYRNEILKNTKLSDYYVVYNDYGSRAYEYFDLVMIRKQSEINMKKADEANSFLIEWLFTKFMYKMDDIEANIGNNKIRGKLNEIKYNYLIFTKV